jgi:hypothetical protein
LLDTLIFSGILLFSGVAAMDVKVATSDILDYVCKENIAKLCSGSPVFSERESAFLKEQNDLIERGGLIFTDQFVAVSVVGQEVNDKLHCVTGYRMCFVGLKVTNHNFKSVPSRINGIPDALRLRSSTGIDGRFTHRLSPRFCESTRKGNDFFARLETEAWHGSADFICDVIRRKVRVNAFGHADAGVTKLLGNDAHRHALHDEVRGMAVAQNMKVCWRAYSGSLASPQHRCLLLGDTPWFAIGSDE